MVENAPLWSYAVLAKLQFIYPGSKQITQISVSPALNILVIILIIKQESEIWRALKHLHFIWKRSVAIHGPWLTGRTRGHAAWPFTLAGPYEYITKPCMRSIAKECSNTKKTKTNMHRPSAPTHYLISTWKQTQDGTNTKHFAQDGGRRYYIPIMQGAATLAVKHVSLDSGTPSGQWIT